MVTLTNEEVWLRAWCAVSNDPRVTNRAVCDTWADACLKAFNERFPDSNIKQTVKDNG